MFVPGALGGQSKYLKLEECSYAPRLQLSTCVVSLGSLWNCPNASECTMDMKGEDDRPYHLLRSFVYVSEFIRAGILVIRGEA